MYFSVAIFFSTFSFFSPSLSYFPLHETHSTIYLVWFEFITTSIRFHNNIPHRVFTINCNQRFKTKKRNEKNCSLLKNMFVLSIILRNGKNLWRCIKFLLHVSLPSSPIESFHYYGQSWYFPTTFSMHFNFLSRKIYSLFWFFHSFPC